MPVSLETRKRLDQREESRSQRLRRWDGERLASEGHVCERAGLHCEVRHSLTVSSRSRAARAFLSHLTTFAKTVRVFLQGIGEVTEADRLAMRDQWESDMLDPEEDDPYYSGLMASSDDYRHLLEDMNLYTIKQTKVDRDGEPIGVTPRLVKVCWTC